jgi:YD repeat-containing protein
LTSIVKAPEGELTGFVYDAYGRLSRQNNANGTYTEYGYDGLDRVNAIAHRKSDTSVLTSESYNYSAASNLENMTVDGVTTNYGYERSSSIAACRDRSL